MHGTRNTAAVALLFLLAACGSGTGPSVVVLQPAPIVELQPTADGWSAEPVKEELDEVSNNGAGYTGDIDVYALEMPADGRLQISLSWAADSDSDFDLVLATDERGETRLAEGLEQGPIPEYIGAEVTAGQKLWIFVAGWEGTPGEYTLETMLMNPGIEKFALESITDGSSQLPRNTPIELVFNQELDPTQPVDEIAAFIGSAEFAPGRWCIDGKRLVFLPRLPEGPDDNDVLQSGFEYLLQIPRAARGLRATTGEYLDAVEGAAYRFSDWADPAPTAPPRVLRIDRDPSDFWDGVDPLTIEISGALDPSTVSVLLDIEEMGIVPSATRLTQQFECDGSVVSRLEVRAVNPFPSFHRVIVSLPGTIRRLGGTNGLTSLGSTTPGLGAAFVFHTR